MHKNLSFFPPMKSQPAREWKANEKKMKPLNQIKRTFIIVYANKKYSWIKIVESFFYENDYIPWVF